MSTEELMNQEGKSYGHITVGVGTSERREIQIIEYLQADYIDRRVAMISKLESEEGYVIGIENLPSSGRSAQMSMWLSEESLLAVLGTVHIYFERKGIDIGEMLKKSIGKDEIHFSYSDNLIEPTE